MNIEGLRAKFQAKQEISKNSLVVCQGRLIRLEKQGKAHGLI